MSPPRRLPPIWLMGLTNSLFGLMGGFAVVTLPELLAAQGIPGGHIAAITAAILSPGFWVFVLAPMLDVRLSRRSYALLFGLLAAAAVGFTVFDHRRPAMVEAVMIAGYVAANLYQGAVGGWMGSLIEKDQDSRLGVWFAVANTGAAGLMLLFLAIPAPRPDRRLARESFGRFWAEVASLLKQHEVLIALALFLLPSASFSLTNVLGGVGGDFSASQRTVSLFAGAGTVLAGLAGSFLLRPLAKRFPCARCISASASPAALFTLSQLAFPRAPWSFALAITGENLFQALAFAAATPSASKSSVRKTHWPPLCSRCSWPRPTCLLCTWPISTVADTT